MCVCVSVCLSVQAPEHVVVKVDHAVVATLFSDSRGRERLAASHRQLTGYLVDSNGNVVRQVSKPGKPDKVHVHVQYMYLLQHIHVHTLCISHLQLCSSLLSNPPVVDYVYHASFVCMCVACSIF